MSRASDVVVMALAWRSRFCRKAAFDLSFRAVRDAVQPACELSWLAERAAFAHQHQKRGLERVLRVAGVAQNAPANAQHQRSMARQQHGKGSLVLRLEELRQELIVGQSLQLAGCPRRRKR
jgi:hypothetical protein